MLKLTSGMLTIALLTTACGSSRGPEVAAAEPPAQAATPASPPQPAPEQPKMATPTSEGDLVRPRASRLGDQQRHTREMDRLELNLLPLQSWHELEKRLFTANSPCRLAPRCRWS